MNKYAEEPKEEDGRTITLLKTIDKIEKLECKLEKLEHIVYPLALTICTQQELNDIIYKLKKYFVEK
jgi:hypothetical protein